MKAIRIHNYGSSEQLKYEEINIPVINDNQILVKVYATSVNHLEIKLASGVMKDVMSLDFPWVPGFDFAGVVESVGKNITGFEKNDEVYGNCNGGSYAEYLAVDVSKVAKKPNNLSFIAASSVPHVAETAWQAIHIHGNLQKGQKVLIHGAAGAVGAYAVQFAHRTGAIVYATASFSNKKLVESLGADFVIDYKNTDFTTVAHDMDLVVDLVGGETQRKSYLVLKEGGRMVTTVGIQSEDEAKKYKVNAISMVIQQSAKNLQIITEMIEKNLISTDVTLVFALDKAADAWDIINRKDPTTPPVSHGKIVLEILKEE